MSLERYAHALKRWANDHIYGRSRADPRLAAAFTGFDALGSPAEDFPALAAGDHGIIHVVILELDGVVHAWQQLMLAELLLAGAPNPQVEPSQFLEYHFEHWVQSAYVLRNRTLRYLRGVAKLYSGSWYETGTHDIAKRYVADSKNQLEELIDVRNRVVHEGGVGNRYTIPTRYHELRRRETGQDRFAQSAAATFDVQSRQVRDMLRNYHKIVLKPSDEAFERVHALILVDCQLVYPTASS